MPKEDGIPKYVKDLSRQIVIRMIFGEATIDQVQDALEAEKPDEPIMYQGKQYTAAELAELAKTVQEGVIVAINAAEIGALLTAGILNMNGIGIIPVGLQEVLKKAAEQKGMHYDPNAHKFQATQESAESWGDWLKDFGSLRGDEGGDDDRGNLGRRGNWQNN